MSPAMVPSELPVSEMLPALPERRRDEAAELIAMMREVTGAEPVIWAGKIVGFGRYRYRYDSGHEGIAPLAGFAPTARQQTVYLISDFQTRYPRLVEALPVDPEASRGGPRLSKACLYLSRLDSVRPEVLRQLVERTVRVYRAMDAGTSGAE